MSTTKEVAAEKAVEASKSQATAAETQIQWATTPIDATKTAELEAQFEAMRSRNWVTDRMVEQYQKHWHCSRHVALERLLAKVGS
jgi:hypothetical protein